MIIEKNGRVPRVDDQDEDEPKREQKRLEEMKEKIAGYYTLENMIKFHKSRKR
jgi:hypothetical protein